MMASTKRGTDLHEGISTTLGLYQTAIAFSVAGLLLLMLGQSPHCPTLLDRKPMDIYWGCDKMLRPATKEVLNYGVYCIGLAAVFYLISPLFFIFDAMERGKSSTSNPYVTTKGGFGFQFFLCPVFCILNAILAYIIHGENIEIHILIEVRCTGPNPSCVT